ncbi:hypothetical protein E0Z10_g9297 [Xylaria hypoxylon]|uniref:VWFA domain-containing protein n=1 Tax=Xylaria hypoxylon TaxID=37992 RepID=A0A4Z0YSN3_9PEZI|nr:hypothetical protein E0Z10_g9297 [Xylaria hypoxylon]
MKIKTPKYHSATDEPCWPNPGEGALKKEDSDSESIKSTTTLMSDDDLVTTIHPLESKDGVLVRVQPPVQPLPPATGHVPCDIVLVIDVSISMGDEAPAAVNDEQGNATKEHFGLTVLDLTKHAARTILSTLDKNDRLGIVTFSDGSNVVQELTAMTEVCKALVNTKIDGIRETGMTNLWAGIMEGLAMFEPSHSSGRVPALMVLTDGQPNHMCPGQGYVRKLRTMDPLPATVNTFGFGYEVRSGLLKAIAETCNGNYAFIPDAGMIGTVFVHAVAHLQSTYATQSTLEISAPEGVLLKSTTGNSIIEHENGDQGPGNTGLTIQLGNLHGREETNASEAYIFADAISEEVINNIPSKYYTDKHNISLMEDLNGQITEALSTQQYFRRWGRHYFFSLWNAHAKQLDPGPLMYNDNPFFIQCRDALDKAFDSIPPPEPSNKPRAVEAPKIYSMAKYNCRDNPCFAATSPVLLATGNEVPVCTLRQGMSVQTPVGPRRVRALLKTQSRSSAAMCHVERLIVTPWHPVKIDKSGQSEWVFPMDVAKPTIGQLGSVYSVLLEPGDVDAHAIRIGGVWGVTLGHGILSGSDARAHHFLGDYDAVSKELATLGSSEHGVYDSAGVKRNDRTGMVCGFERLSSIHEDEATSMDRLELRSGLLEICV